MEIHELNTFSGTLGAGDFFATDNGSDTSKVSAEDMFSPINTRIDNIITSPAPSAQEVTDARLGDNGVVYSSLGVAIRSQVAELKTAIEENSDVSIIDNWNMGKYIITSSSPVDVTDLKTLAAYRCAVIDCAPGDVFTINGEGAVSPRLWAFIDASGNLRTVAQANVIGNDLVIKAPTLTAKLVINDRDGTGVCYKGVYLASRVSELEASDSKDYTSLMNNGYINTAQPYGTVVNPNTIVSSGSYKCCAFDVKKGDTILLTGTGGISARLWAFLSPTNTVITTSLIGAVCNNEAINVEADGKCIISVKTDSPYSVIHIKNMEPPKQGLYGTNEEMAFFLRRNYSVKYANALRQMHISNYTDDPQNVHPKVLYFEEGFGGHKYWMAYTPYPNGHTEYENPCVAFSDDGVSWGNYRANPLAVNIRNGTVNYNSDTHLVYTGTRLECWWRFINVTNSVEIIYRRTTTDGTTWSAAEEIMRHNTQASLLSPSVIYDGSKYCMWVVNSTSAPVIEYWESDANATTWNLVRTIDLDYQYDSVEYIPWHLDVILDDGKYIAVVMCKDNINSAHNTKWTAFITTSTDNVTYTTPEAIIEGNSENWDAMIYRSSIVKVRNMYRIYYSARSIAGKYGIGITQSPLTSKFVGLL